MSSSGLVVPSASSAARLGNETSYVPSLELDSSTWPEPSCRVPFQAVRAVRVGMSLPPAGRRPLLDGASTGPYPVTCGVNALSRRLLRC